MGIASLARYFTPLMLSGKPVEPLVEVNKPPVGPVRTIPIRKLQENPPQGLILINSCLGKLQNKSYFFSVPASKALSPPRA